MNIEAEEGRRVGCSYPPTVWDCYSNGWKQMTGHFLELLLITVIMFAVSAPIWWAGVLDELEYPGAVLFNLFAMGYYILIIGPVGYGSFYAFLRAARGDGPQVKDMFHFTENYLNVVLARLLSAFIICVGMMLFIIPGIIFACKLAFVSFLVVEEKMDAVEAVKESWRMTNGHAMTIFLFGICTIPIALAGLICMGVGIVVSVMWIKATLASIYHSVKITQETGA